MCCLSLTCPSTGFEFSSFCKRASAIAALFAVALCPLAALSQARAPQLPRSSHGSGSQISPAQRELQERIEAVNAAQASGNPVGIAEANKQLLAVLLRLMGQLRSSEGAYRQASELYSASLAFEVTPGLHGELAMADQLAGNQTEAIEQGKLALAEHPADPQLEIMLGRAYLAKKQYVQADKVMTDAARLNPDIKVLYLLAVSWLDSGAPEGRKHADAVFEQMKSMAGDSGSLHVLIGRAYRDAGLMPDAVKEFNRAIAMDPATPHAHAFLGLAAFAMNEWLPTPKATTEMQKELQYHPDDFLANYIMGVLDSTQHQYSLADKYLEVARKAKPDWPEVYLYLGLDAFAEGDNKKAEPMLRKAIELTGSDVSRSNYQIRRAYVDLGRILAKSGRQQEADAFAAKARDLENRLMHDSQQNATASFLAEGGTRSAMGGYVPLKKADERAETVANASSDAAARLDAVVIANSNLTDAGREAAKAEEDTLRPILGQSYSDLATAQAIQHDYASAFKNYEAAEQWDPHISDLAKNLGQAAYHAGNYSEAARGLSKAVQEKPDALALRAMLGMAYFQMQKYGDAATAFYPLGEAGMHDPVVGYAWAYSLTKTGDLKDASQVLALYQTETLPNDALLLAGQLWTEIGDYDRAITTMRQVLASDPSFPKVHYSMALTYIRAGKWNDARSELNAQLALTPSDPDAMFNLGFVDLQESKKDDAMKRFQQVIAKDPKYGDAQYQMGKLLLESGRVEQSLPHLQAAARLMPDKDYVHYQLQAAYRRLSRPADAERELALYQQIKAKSRAAATAQVDARLQQKQ